MKTIIIARSSRALTLRSAHPSFRGPPSTPSTIAAPCASPCPHSPSGTTRQVVRSFRVSPAQSATVVPVHGTGPPPDPPQPSADIVARKRRQAALLRQAKDLRTGIASGGGAANSGDGSRSVGLLKRRFWKHVHVREVDGAFEVHLDSRPLRRPNTKGIIRLPLTKPHLADALALEWDNLLSAQEATKQHLIPLTGLICRALDIVDEDAKYGNPPAATATATATTSSGDVAPIRHEIAATLLRFLDTDGLLCWAPPTENPLTDGTAPDAAGRSLRDVQEAAARPIVAFLTGRVWPGTELRPVLDGASIMPRAQLPGTREVVQGWLLGLSHWELAGLERAALAGKGLLGAARLVVEWSEGPAGVRSTVAEGPKEPAVSGEADGVTPATDAGWFGVEEAARVASLEVDWQTSRWGEVEDTHDVEKHDLLRQLGGVVLLVSGTGGAASKSVSGQPGP